MTSSFFEEVKRRKVYRVAVAYVIAAGGMIQLASAVFPAWELPSWTLRLVIVLLLVGFPIALLLAWAFDVTPQGVRATDPALGAGARPRGRRNLWILVALGILLSAGVGFLLLPHASAKKIDKSIAVLPFENLSEDKENAFFADGIQDDILTSLAKVGDLKVISRTSVMKYRAKSASVREIGKALGVSAILEGSVRPDRKNNRVRVNVQLINAENDEHIWAEDYDRELTDVFAIQSDLAQKIANELQAKLSPREKAQMTRKPTENGEAYFAFVQARNLFQPEDYEKLKQAEQLYQRALTLDPNFAIAWASASNLESWIYHTFDASVARKGKAREMAEKALQLEPDLPEGHLALGYCYYYGDLDFDRALQEFEIARRGLPNNADVLLAVGAIQRREGKWAESTATFARALQLNPQSVWVIQNLGVNYQALRQYENAEKTYERGLALDPKSLGLRSMQIQLALLWKGDLKFGEEQLANAPAGFDPSGMVTQARVGFLIYRRQYATALRLLQTLPGETVHAGNGVEVSKRDWEGALYLLMGEKEKAIAAYEEARVFTENLVRQRPEDANLRMELGMIYAVLGRRDDAIREGKKGVQLVPESKDAYDGPNYSLRLAQIYAWTGDSAEALALLEKSLQTPNGVSAEMLGIDVSYDPLRSDPRFQALIEKYRVKA
ncbi:MAG: tetratricopeptide repeat protein [Verrucomicrobiota bacterium]